MGGGRFANPVAILTPGTPQVVRVADFTGNRISDLAVLTSTGVSIYLGNGKGGFLPPVTYNAGVDPTGLTVADMLGNGLKQGFPTYLEDMRQRIERLLLESRALQVTDLAVDGHDVMRELGLGPGPSVRAALEALLEEVLDDPSRNTRDHLLARLRHRRTSIAPRA